MISIPVWTLVLILLAIAGGPISMVAFVFGAILFGFIQNGPAAIRTYLSSFIPITIVLAGSRKKLVVIYPPTVHFIEFHFIKRNLSDILSEADKPLPADEIKEILKNPKVRFWLKIRFAKRLMLPDHNDDGYLFVEIGATPEKDVYYRTEKLNFRRIAIINVIQSEKLAQ